MQRLLGKLAASWRFFAKNTRAVKRFSPRIPSSFVDLGQHPTSTFLRYSKPPRPNRSDLGG